MLILDVVIVIVSSVLVIVGPLLGLSPKVKRMLYGVAGVFYCDVRMRGCRNDAVCFMGRVALSRGDVSGGSVCFGEGGGETALTGGHGSAMMVGGGMPPTEVGGYTRECGSATGYCGFFALMAVNGALILG